MTGTEVSLPKGSFLSLLHPEDRERLLVLGSVRRYPPGAPLIFQGDHSDSVFVILAGRVKVAITALDGHEAVLTILGPGELAGEFEAIDFEGGPRTASNVALEPVECRVVRGGEFRQILDSQPRIAPILLRVIIRRLRAADRRRADSGSLDTVHRLARLLVELVKHDHDFETGAVDVDLPLTQEELASLIAASRESVVRALSVLRSRGLITTARRRITVRDATGLRAIADA